MKNLLLCVVIAMFSFVVNAQKLQNGKFSLGGSVAIPVGNINNVSNVALSVDSNYLLKASDEFDVGASASYLRYFGSDVSSSGSATTRYNDISFLPLAGAVRYNFSEKIVFGADLGYAIALNSGVNGGFYYKPMVAYNWNGKLQLNLFYSGISANGGNASSIGVGFTIPL